jgi:hypothetical protein
MSGRAEHESSCPLSEHEVLEAYFLEHRAKLLDLAAFLDRLERASPSGAASDPRWSALRQALSVLDDGEGERARRVQEIFSDPSTEPAERAEGKACGAPASPEAESEKGG